MHSKVTGITHLPGKHGSITVFQVSNNGLGCLFLALKLQKSPTVLHGEVPKQLQINCLAAINLKKPGSLERGSHLTARTCHEQHCPSFMPHN